MRIYFCIKQSIGVVSFYASIFAWSKQNCCELGQFMFWFNTCYSQNRIEIGKQVPDFTEILTVVFERVFCKNFVSPVFDLESIHSTLCKTQRETKYALMYHIVWI